MVRTKADGGSGSRKVVSSSAPRKSLGSSSSGASSSSAGSPAGKGGKYLGGNGYCPRPTPDWQKGIGMFLAGGQDKDKENDRPDDNADVEVTGTSQICKPGSSASEAGPSCSTDEQAGPSCSTDD